MRRDDSRPVTSEPTGKAWPYCRTCRRALNVATSPSGPVSYRHAEELRGGAVDHPADPVPLSALGDPVMECDFCSAPDPAWTYVCADQETETRVVTARTVGMGDYRHRHQAARTLNVETRPGITHTWGQRWATCEGCAALIERRDLYGLVGRVADAMPAKYTRGNRLARTRGELHANYSNVFATLQPGRGRITPEHPLGLWEPTEPPTEPPTEQPTIDANPPTHPQANSRDDTASRQRRP